MVQQVSAKPIFPPKIAPYIDVAAYLLDARAPAATLWLDPQLVGRELILLTRADQAQTDVTRHWRAHLARAGYPCLIVSSTEQQGFDAVKDHLARLLAQKTKLATSRGIANPTLRMAALGVPNVGKSTFLNKLIGVKRLRTGDKPGITRGPQWVRVFEDVDVLDTAGILRDAELLRRRKPYWLLLNLMPYDPGDIPLHEQAVDLLREKLPEGAWKALAQHYKLDSGSLELAQAESMALLEGISAARSYKLTNSDALDRARHRLIRDFQTGRFGRVSLERPGSDEITSPVFTARAGGSDAPNRVE